MTTIMKESIEMARNMDLEMRHLGVQVDRHSIDLHHVTRASELMNDKLNKLSERIDRLDAKMEMVLNLLSGTNIEDVENKIRKIEDER